jgi:hypothetical protein
MEPLATGSLLVSVRTVEEGDGPAPRDVAMSLALTDTGAKPR